MGKRREILLKTIQEDEDTLYQIIRSYVLKMRLVNTGDDVDIRTQEIFNEMVVAALQAVDRYDPARRPIPWLLGIAIHRIQRCLSQRQREQKREISVRDLYPGTQAMQSDDELFERIAQMVNHPDHLEVQQQLDSLLFPLSEQDREIVQLAVLQEMDAPSIATHLAITPTAARVRLHRALKRLRGHLNLKEVLNQHE